MSEPRKQKYVSTYTISGTFESEATSLAEHELRFAQFSQEQLGAMGKLDDVYHESDDDRAEHERAFARAMAISRENLATEAAR